jgi:peptide deformylase
MQTDVPQAEEATLVAESELHYRGPSDFAPTPAQTEFYVADHTPNQTTFSLIKLAWKDPTCRSDHLWDMLGLWISSASDWQTFFTEVDEEEGGQRLWKKKLYQWWSDNWYLLGLFLLAICLTAFGAWVFLSPGKDRYGGKNAYLLPPVDVYDWSGQPEKAKLHSTRRCIPFKKSELDNRRMDHGPYLANLESAVKDIMDQHQYGALTGIHLGKDYNRCFAGYWDQHKQETVFMINPQIKGRSSGTRTVSEDSIFCKGQMVDVERPTSVNLEYTTAEGKLVLVTIQGASAAFATHAIEQLDGTCVCNV